MPKEKRKRTPLHAKAAARAAGVPLTTIIPEQSTAESISTHIHAAADPEPRSTSYHDGLHLTKKEKRHAKRQEFLSKLDSTYNAKSIEAKRKKEAAKNLNVNLNPLTASLPELLSLPEEQRHKLHASSIAPSTIPQMIGQSSKGANSKKARKKIAAQEMQRFNAVLQHPAFRKNPLQTIHQHTQNTLVKRPGAQTDQPMLVER